MRRLRKSVTNSTFVRPRWEALELILLGLGLTGLFVTLALNILKSSSTLASLDGSKSAILYSVGAVIAGTGLALKWWKDRELRRRDYMQTLADLIALPLAKSGALPQVSDVSPYDIGVTKSRYSNTPQDRYVHRENADEKLDEALREKRFVLLVGKSKAGKSRTAIEALVRNLGNAYLLVPQSRNSALSRLLGPGSPLKIGLTKTVIWLDNVGDFLGTGGGLDKGVLIRLKELPAHVIVLATIRADIRQKLFDTGGELGNTAQAVLDDAFVIPLESEMTPTEMAEAQALYPDELFQRGIGEHLIAASVLEQRYQDGRLSDGIGRVGWALVQASIDYQRAGLTKPIRETDLRSLYSIYLPRYGRWAIPDDDSYARGLDWALQEPSAAPIALLETRTASPDRSFEALDYIVAYVDSWHHDHQTKTVNVPRETWNFLIDHVNPEELLDVGWAAYVRAETDVAETCYARGMSVDDPQVSSHAAANAGFLLYEEGRYEDAGSALLKAITSGIDTAARMAALFLSTSFLHHNRGIGEVIQLFEATSGLGSPKDNPRSALALAWVLMSVGASDDAKAWCQRVNEMGSEFWRHGAAIVAEWPEIVYHLTQMGLNVLSAVIAGEGQELESITSAFAKVIDGDWTAAQRELIPVLAARYGEENAKVHLLSGLISVAGYDFRTASAQLDSLIETPATGDQIRDLIPTTARAIHQSIDSLGKSMEAVHADLIYAQFS